MIASITELRIKNWLGFLRFIPHAVRCKAEAERSYGVISVQVAAESLFVQRTLTVWESKDAMMAFVRSAPHLKAMKAFGAIANTSYTALFEVTEQPTWEQALTVLKKQGRASG